MRVLRINRSDMAGKDTLSGSYVCDTCSKVIRCTESRRREKERERALLMRGEKIECKRCTKARALLERMEHDADSFADNDY